MHKKERTPEQELIHRHRIGYACAALAGFCGAWQGSCMKFVQNQGVRPLDTVTILFLFAAVLIHGYLLATGKYKTTIHEARANIKGIWPLGILNFLTSTGSLMAIKTIPASVVSALTYTAPAMVVIFFMITKLKPISLVNKLAVIVSLAGCMLALNVFNVPLSELAFSGIAWTLLGAGCIAVYNLLCDLVIPPVTSPITVMTVSLTMSCLISIAINPTMFVRIPQVGWYALGLFLLVAFLSKICVLTFQVKAVAMAGAERASVIQATEVPFTLLLAYLFVRETILPVQMVGIALVLLSVALLQRR